MGDLRPVIYILGIFVLTVGLAMLVPGLADLLVGNPDYNAFFASSAVALFFGGMMVAGGYTDHIDLDVRRGFLLTSTSWMLVSFFAALPFIFANLKLDMADAYFEAMSGLTTTVTPRPARWRTSAGTW